MKAILRLFARICLAAEAEPRYFPASRWKMMQRLTEMPRYQFYCAAKRAAK
jgi:hypothetical protein